MTPISPFGKWMALTAALLGWLFDGFEMGLFPLVARPALVDLLTDQSGVRPTDSEITAWYGIMTAFFLVGAATGGVLFGWIGDRFGRVRSMMLSVLTYALVSGACGFATSAWQFGALRFVASLGMGGEWSLGVALVNELWPDKSRAFLAGLMGAAGNVGYLVIALVGLGLGAFIDDARQFLLNVGVGDEFVEHVLKNGGWRFLMMLAAAPALLTFFIRAFVPESARWEHERDKGSTGHWVSTDLIGVLIGGVGAVAIIVVWMPNFPSLVKSLADLPDGAMIALRVTASLVGLFVAVKGYTYPVKRFLARSEGDDVPEIHGARPTFRRMLLGACLSGVALLGTWGSVQQAPSYASGLIKKSEEKTWQEFNIQGLAMPPENDRRIKAAAQIGASYTQAISAFGATIGTLVAALLAARFGRRMTYFALCLGSFVVVPTFYLTQSAVDGAFLTFVFFVGAITASFYGWLPLYLPEIFRTAVRATGQGFAFNFGRILAAIGVLQLANFPGGLPFACSALSSVYLLGMALIRSAPETKGRPLPE